MTPVHAMCMQRNAMQATCSHTDLPLEVGARRVVHAEVVLVLGAEAREQPLECARVDVRVVVAEEDPVEAAELGAVVVQVQQRGEVAPRARRVDALALGRLTVRNKRSVVSLPNREEL